MSLPIALKIEKLRKTFRVPHSEMGLATDPRREACNRRCDWLHVLRDIDLSVPRGETLGVIGYNGSGKSTLFKILAGVSGADKGSFHVEGRLGALLELGAGFHPELTGVQNVYLNGAVMGLGRREINRIIPEIIEFAELERFMDMPVKHFSSGMVTRLGFAMATRLNPDVLLLDETFAVGDLRFQTRALDYLRVLKSQGKTLLLVSHNAQILRSLVDRVVWLEAGKIAQDGSAREILTSYAQTLELKNRRGDLRQSGVGCESVYLDSDPQAGVVSLDSVVLTSDGAPARLDAEGAAELENGARFGMEIALKHPGAHPAAAVIETAWVRSDDCVTAQSLTPVRLEPGATTRLSLDFGPMALVEAAYTLAMAVSPERGAAANAENQNDWPWQHFDRRSKAARLKIVTPTPYDSPMILTLAGSWTAGGGMPGNERG